MHFLLISHGIYPINQLGGVELFTSEVAHFLAEHSAVTVLVFTSGPKAEPSEQRIGKITIKLVPGSENLSPHKDFTSEDFYSFLKNLEPDMVYIVSPYNFPFQLSKELVKLNVPWIIHLHDFYLMCPQVKLLRQNNKICTRPKRLRCTQCLSKISHPLQFIKNFTNFNNRNSNARILLEKSKAVLCVSKHAAKLYNKHLGLAREKIIFASPTWQKDLNTQPEGTSHNTLQIGHFGGARYPKGMHILAKALLQIKCSWKVTIYDIEADRHREKIPKLFKGNEEHVRLRKPFTPEILDEIFTNLDVVVIPSIWPETYSRVADEALARKIIVVAADIGGMGERLVDGVNSFAVQAGDEKTLAAKITFICNNLNTIRSSMQFDLMLPSSSDSAEKILNICKDVAENKLKSGFLFDHKEDIHFISKLTGLPIDKVELQFHNELKNPGSTVNNAWIKAGHPKSEDEINNFYESTDAYLYDLIAAHSFMWERNQWRRLALSTLIRLGCQSVLDYGAGAGYDSLLFAKAGLEATCFDVNKYLLEYIQHSAAIKGLDLQITQDLHSLPEKSFDAVYCTEVLEHVPNPPQVLENVSRLLKDNGYFLVTESFGSHEKNFSHLDENAVYDGQLNSLANKVGLYFLEVLPTSGNKMFVFELKE